MEYEQAVGWSVNHMLYRGWSVLTGCMRGEGGGRKSRGRRGEEEAVEGGGYIIESGV